MAGNQGLHSAENGRKGGRPRLEATKLRVALIAAVEGNAERLAEALVVKALSGDISAIKEVLDRALGKAPAAIKLTTCDETPHQWKLEEFAACAKEREAYDKKVAEILRGNDLRLVFNNPRAAQLGTLRAIGRERGYGFDSCQPICVHSAFLLS